MVSYQLYRDLELNKSASEHDIKSKYKKLARLHHPDKGGDPEIFKKIGHAYEILSDPIKKSQYDMCGGHEKPPAFSTTSFPFETSGFGSFHSHMFANMRPHTMSTIKPVVQFCEVNLDDLLYGTQQKVNVNHNVLCGSCTGTGVTGMNVHIKCNECDGAGQKTYIHQAGRGMIQQITSECTKCKGSGIFISDQDRCRACIGKGYTMNKSTITINIPPGARSNMILLKDPKKGGYVRNVQTNKLIPIPLMIRLKLKKHDIFTRYDKHLLCTIDITLWDTLCGVYKSIPYLKNTRIRFKTPPNMVCSPLTSIECKNYGLPIDNISNHRGSLFIHLNIIFPTQLTKTELARSIGTFCTSVNDTDDASIVNGVIVPKTHVEQLLRSTDSSSNIHTDDEELHFKRTPGPECNTQ